LNSVLLAVDEYPFHQTTATFASAATSDPAWNDGHYVTATDITGTISFTSNVRLYANNDVIDGFVCLRHRGRQYNIRVSRALRPDMESLRVGPLRLEIIRPLEEVRLILEPCTIADGVVVALDVACRTHTAPYMGPVEVKRLDGRLISERATYELAGPCTGTIRVGDETVEWAPGTARFFRNHSWGVHPGRGGPRPHGKPVPSHRAPGTRHWVLFDMDDHSGFFFVDPSGRAASGKGAILEADRVVPVVDVQTEVQFYEPHSRVRSGNFVLTDVEGRVREYEYTDHGWVYCQGGGYFGGFNDGLGQGVYRGASHIEGEVWDVSHPVEITREDHTWTYDHDWAENFVSIRHNGVTGLGHYECVTIRP
jgi:hypothetical protein